MQPKLIVANWKENPATEARALALFRGALRAAAAAAASGRAKPSQGGARIVVCPPFIHLEALAALRRKLRARDVALGAQDVFWEERGAFTGEIGPGMLRSLGAEYAIVGHSERRKYLHETDRMINGKIKRAVADGLRAILCVGEPLAVRKKGVAAAKTFIKNQLKKDLAGIAGIKMKKKLIIAYEPVWAIGTGRNDSPRDAAMIAEFIKSQVPGFGARSSGLVPVLYGGSVTGKNIRDYVTYKEIDGALVGGASLHAGEFGKIVAGAGNLAAENPPSDKRRSRGGRTLGNIKNK